MFVKKFKDTELVLNKIIKNVFSQGIIIWNIENINFKMSSLYLKSLIQDISVNGIDWLFPHLFYGLN